MKFSSFALNEKILSAISSKGYTDATPIQEKSIPLQKLFNKMGT